MPRLGFEIAKQEVVLQRDAALEGLMPALDFAMVLGVIETLGFWLV
jgi:hypothetical protein